MYLLRKLSMIGHGITFLSLIQPLPVRGHTRRAPLCKKCRVKKAGAFEITTRRGARRDAENSSVRTSD